MRCPVFAETMKNPGKTTKIPHISSMIPQHDFEAYLADRQIVQEKHPLYLGSIRKRAFRQIAALLSRRKMLTDLFISPSSNRISLFHQLL